MLRAFRLATLLQCLATCWVRPDVRCCWLKFVHFQTWANNTQHVAKANRVTKRAQHVVPNNAAVLCVKMLRSLGREISPVHTTPEELKTEILLWKRIKGFPSTLPLRNLKNAKITGHLGFVFEENSGGEIAWLLSRRHRSWKAPFSKCFPSTREQKAGVFKLFRFDERFRKASFSWRTCVGGKPNRRNKAVFSNTIPLT